MKETSAYVPLAYIESNESVEMENRYSSMEDSRPFASKNGKTYTFSWCQGAKNISTKNKIIFNNEEAARNSGRTLSKLCQK